MWNKTLLALAAVSVVGCASTAFAEDPDNKIGDKYPLLEQRYAPVPTTRAVRTTQKLRQVPNSYTPANDVADDKIGDRYPFLETRAATQKTPARTARVRASSTSADDALTTGSIRGW